MNPKTGELAKPEDFETPSDPNKLASTPPENVGYVKRPQDLAREEMAKRAHQRRLKEAASFVTDTMDDDGNITPAVVPEQPAEPKEVPLPSEEEPESAAEATSPNQTAEAPSPAAAPPAAPESSSGNSNFRELIVDGKLLRIPTHLIVNGIKKPVDDLQMLIDDGVRTRQKESAADMRLAAATELMRSAQERQAATPTPQAPQPAQPSDDDAALARSIQFGTEEEAKAAIAKLRNATPAITPQQIEAFAQQALQQRLPDHIAFHDANNWLKTEWSAITSDPDLKAMFDMKEDQARKAGDRRPYRELYADIAGQMATKFNLKKAEVSQPKGQPIETTQASDRITRKANSPRPVTGASGRVEQAQPPKRAPTVAEYVQQQRQRRGLQPLDKQGV